jgi:hypothetical protein
MSGIVCEKIGNNEEFPSSTRLTIINCDVKDNLSGFWAERVVIGHVDDQVIMERPVDVMHTIKLIQLTVIVVQHEGIDSFVVISPHNRVLHLWNITQKPRG